MFTVLVTFVPPVTATAVPVVESRTIVTVPSLAMVRDALPTPVTVATSTRQFEKGTA
jgi:hypothetical protein